MTSLVTSSQSADGLREQSQESAVARSSSELQWIQTQATAHPVESFNEPAVAMNPVASFAYPVDMESIRKKANVMESYNPDARFQSQYLKIQQKRKAVEECISSEAVDDLQELDVNC
ncbi:7-ethoxycoumarin O-deethylase-like [Dorcoceras hygrometricum]|uniref:7-ethoxycoumarin O-deethylase-like n=1 Tax=Dorcoceras hygrometricum TaxID=472368 RepID=A0A2Z7A5K9_9LAMI|nr:7-ethoxycoumarin O-deethylase-like [Dorcoceras hygrometricum]